MIVEYMGASQTAQIVDAIRRKVASAIGAPANTSAADLVEIARKSGVTLPTVTASIGQRAQNEIRAESKTAQRRIPNVFWIGLAASGAYLALKQLRKKRK